MDDLGEALFSETSSYGQHYFNGHLITFVKKLFEDWNLGWGGTFFLTKLKVILALFFMFLFSVQKNGCPIYSEIIEMTRLVDLGSTYVSNVWDVKDRMLPKKEACAKSIQSHGKTPRHG